jgi:hypothetical protein
MALRSEEGGPSGNEDFACSSSPRLKHGEREDSDTDLSGPTQLSVRGATYFEAPIMMATDHEKKAGIQQQKAFSGRVSFDGK